jgi:DNA-binding Xre family transcriptional regulator
LEKIDNTYYFRLINTNIKLYVDNGKIGDILKLESNMLLNIFRWRKFMGCIYQIRNLKNGRLYIGSSKDIEHRFRVHKHDLKHNKHHAYKLQQDWNIYGENSFVFEIVEEINNQIDLKNQEQFWIDKFNTYTDGYNTYNREFKKINSKNNIKLCYDKLKNILLERNIKLTSLVLTIGLSSNITTAINNNQNLSLVTLAMICTYLKVSLNDVVDIISE